MSLGAGTPTAWTTLQNDDPDHLGLRCNALPEHQMALITSDCGATRFPEHQMAVITSDCGATRFPEHQMAVITSDLCVLQRRDHHFAAARASLAPDETVILLTLSLYHC